MRKFAVEGKNKVVYCSKCCGLHKALEVLNESGHVYVEIPCKCSLRTKPQWILDLKKFKRSLNDD